MSGFRLYPRAEHWWSLADYGAVLAVMQERRPKRVLEFGPGSSTLALIEGGAELVDACEDDPKWEAVYRARLEERFPDVVTIVPYTWSDPVSIPQLERESYDLALIDGPRTTENRVAVVRYCIERCGAVLVPLEEQAPGLGYLRPHVIRLAEEYGCELTLTQTGPLAGGFALLS